MNSFNFILVTNGFSRVKFIAHKSDGQYSKNEFVAMKLYNKILFPNIYFWNSNIMYSTSIHSKTRANIIMLKSYLRNTMAELFIPTYNFMFKTIIDKYVNVIRLDLTNWRQRWLFTKMYHIQSKKYSMNWLKSLVNLTFEL